METVTLHVFSVDTPKAVGFRKMEPPSPVGLRFALYLPSNEDTLTTYGQLVDIVTKQIIDSPLFPWKISYININYGDYCEDSSIVLAQYLQDFPMTHDCRINCPASLVFGGGL